MNCTHRGRQIIFLPSSLVLPLTDHFEQEVSHAQTAAGQVLGQGNICYVGAYGLTLWLRVGVRDLFIYAGACGHSHPHAHTHADKYMQDMYACVRVCLYMYVRIHIYMQDSGSVFRSREVPLHEQLREAFGSCRS